jgi:hypothetical protein
MLAIDARIPAGEYSDVPIRLLGVHTASPNEHGRFRVRDQQLTDIAKLVQQSDGESIVIGDMNITPWSDAFKELLSSTNLVDSIPGVLCHVALWAWYRWHPDRPRVGFFRIADHRSPVRIPYHRFGSSMDSTIDRWD